MPESPALFSAVDRDEQDIEFSRVLIVLFKGILYQEVHESQWYALLTKQMAVRDYVRHLGLELVLDESEGYAYLTQADPPDSGEALPRLVAKRPLSFLASLLLALLRKRMIESEASGGGRLILSRDEMVELLRVFLPDRSNEARLVTQVQTAIARVKELGFIRHLEGQAEVFEVLRIVKAFVDAEWLSDFDVKLADYLASRGIVPEGERNNDGVSGTG